MTATTQDRNTPHRGAELLAVPVGAGVVIPAGTMVASNATGFAVPGATSTTLAYLGMADAAADNRDGTDGAIVVTVRRGRQFKWGNHSGDPVTQAGLGRNCYIVDNQTVAASHGTNTRSVAGLVLGIDADGVWVI